MAFQQLGNRTFSHMAPCSGKDYQAIVARLETVWDAATPVQVADGMQWYARRNEELRELAEEYSRTYTGALDVVAYATSALSANTRWERNLRAIKAQVKAYAAGKAQPRTETLYGMSDTKARRILDTRDTTLIGQGAKTRAFAENLLLSETLPDGTPAVTIDTVMYQCATGSVPKSGINAGEYGAIRRAVMFLSKKYNVKPYQLQAVLWVVWRGTSE